MDKLDRLQMLHRMLLSHHYPVPLKKMEQELQCTAITVKRTINILRDFWQAPLEYDKHAKGWRYTDDKFELPGLWLTTDELQSLVALLHILHTMEDGLIDKELDVIEKSIARLLASRGINIKNFTERIKFLPMAKRPVQSNIFAHICEALLKGKQITIDYSDNRGNKTRRAISPQTLAYYRENWYLDSWCHKRNNLRSFLVPRIARVFTSSEPAKKIPDEQLKEHFAGSYGIFAGKATHTAKLKFYPEIAPTIASQQWHPEQKGQWDGDCYLLSFPYGDDRELVLDILKHSNNVEVLGPAKLKKTVVNRLRGALQLYQQ